MPSDQIDISKIKVGDELTVRVTVDRECGSAVVSARDRNGTSAFFGARDIISHTPKALEVGDRVRDPVGYEWEIAAPKRMTEGVAVYGLWRDTRGYDGCAASEVESWERLDAQ